MKLKELLIKIEAGKATAKELNEARILLKLYKQKGVK